MFSPQFPIVPSVVVDLGTHTTRAGFAGQDLPPYIFPSNLGYIYKSPASARNEQGFMESPKVKPKDAPITHAGNTALSHTTDNLHVFSPFSSKGHVENWNDYEALLRYALFSPSTCSIPTSVSAFPSAPSPYAATCSDPDSIAAMGNDGALSQALLFADPIFWSPSHREKVVEIAIESFGAPACYLARAPVLSTYANGKTTAVVVDIGESGTNVVPVIEGGVVKAGSTGGGTHLSGQGGGVRCDVGGKCITDQIQNLLNSKKIDPKMYYQIKKKFKKRVIKEDTVTFEDEEQTSIRIYDVKDVPLSRTLTTSYHMFRKKGLLEGLKESFFVLNDGGSVKSAVPQGKLDGSSDPSAETEELELPDGTVVNLTLEEKHLPGSILFKPLKYYANSTQSHSNVYYAHQQNFQARTMYRSEQLAQHGLPDLISHVIRQCDSSMVRDLYSAICMTGGTSNIPLLYERLSNELFLHFHKVRILAASGAMERKHAAWIGGSILATFSEFQKLWFSKEEYEENGAVFVHKKCP